MNIALLGATGFVGSALLKEALDRGILSPRLRAIRRNLKKENGSLQKLAMFMTLLFL